MLVMLGISWTHAVNFCSKRPLASIEASSFVSVEVMMRSGVFSDLVIIGFNGGLMFF